MATLPDILKRFFAKMVRGADVIVDGEGSPEVSVAFRRRSGGVTVIVKDFDLGVGSDDTVPPQDGKHDPNAGKIPDDVRELVRSFYREQCGPLLGDTPQDTPDATDQLPRNGIPGPADPEQR